MMNKNSKELSLFDEIKRLTSGYLPAQVYREIYKCSYSASEGLMIDIGPAQGGSTIALGLGICHSHKSANSKVISIEGGFGSAALPSSHDVGFNIETLQNNIKFYKLCSICTVICSDVNDVHNKIYLNEQISLIFIDADGALDRDFNLFYNKLVSNGHIIIDDYADIINSLAKERYLKWYTTKQLNDYVNSKGAKRFIDLCPLGKEYTTYRLVNYFLKRGLLLKDKIIGTTFFGHKPPGAIFDPVTDMQEMMKIRQEILDKYYELNPNLMKNKPGNS